MRALVVAIFSILAAYACTRPANVFPADATGDALRRLQAAGDDLTRARDIDFEHIFPSKENASQFVDAAQKAGFQKSEVTVNEEKKMWDARVVVFAVPTYAEISRIERELGLLAKKYSGQSDGWGCLSAK